MSGVNLPLPCEAYTGNEPFAFVSYAHSDAVQVYPEIRRLHEMGYRIWFDEGIDPGNEWPEEIASAIEQAAQFIVFVTDQSVRSKNVRDEIHYALSLEKPFLAIHLFETQLPPGLALRMGAVQAVFKWRMSEDVYWRKLERVFPISIGKVATLETDIREVIPTPHSQEAEDVELCVPPSAPPPQPRQTQTIPDAPGETRTFADIEFVWCPPGTFMMGSPGFWSKFLFGETQHEVTLTSGFWLGKYPVTQAQWEKVMGNNPSGFKGNRQRPVEQVSWDDCQAFLKMINSLEKTAFRLPTEAEWEYACRAGTTTAYCFGDDPAQLDDYAWYTNNSSSQTHPVGQKRPNAWGLYDMHGNVWEWCQDWYGDYLKGAVTDPTGPTSGSYRVNRGGSWYGDPWDCRSARRGRNAPEDRGLNLGFRLALSPVQ